ncbi:MAG TPA: GNAT family N-acetyltransferase [Solirubrobacteraceae bacterium]|jgi:ribosomal protein S18 acetylase RimI-like enzyme|nr:GNAT family N-acetyltransferase [Solirubrobacteraceae bacterium]
MSPEAEASLDNPAYEALCGPHAGFAEIRGRVRRYPVDVAPFIGLPSQPSTQDWRDAAALIAPGAYAAVPYGNNELPESLKVLDTFDLVQMIGERVTGGECAEAVALGAADVPEMLDLVARTEPGPFLARTVEMGDYLGIRSGGELVAMAGERFHLDGWTEISAVCTHPDHRGRGLASQLMGALVAGIQERSEGVFLHALATNVGAIRLYEQLGFRVRQTATIAVVTPAT